MIVSLIKVGYGYHGRSPVWYCVALSNTRRKSELIEDIHGDSDSTLTLSTSITENGNKKKTSLKLFV